MQGWFVVRTHHQREKWVCDNIRRQNAEPYLPMIVERHHKKGGSLKTARAKCLFPGYVFVKTTGAWKFLLGTYGAMDIILQGDQPAMISDDEITRLKAREDVDGFVRLPKKPSGVERFKRGASVRVAEGPFSGYKGIYQGTAPKECQKVLLDFLGRKTTVLIGDEYLEEV